MYRFHASRALAALVVVAASLANGGTAAAVTFTQLEPAGNPLDPHYPVNGGYAANGINDEGLIVGGNNFSGILWGGGSMFGFHAVDAERGARYTQANAIANSATGDTIVGGYSDQNFGRHGFALTNWNPVGFDPSLGLPAIEGTITILDVPAASFTEARGINDIHTIVGNTTDGGFVFDGSTYTVFHIAGSNGTEANDINNNGVIAGTWLDNGTPRGYVASAADINGNLISVFTTIDVPVPGALGTRITGINDDGDLAGYYQDSLGRHHGFFIDDFVQLDYTGLNPANFLFRDTMAFGVNSSDAVVGQTFENVNIDGVIGGHAFLATDVTSIPEPATFIVALFLLPLALTKRCRRSQGLLQKHYSVSIEI
jgi:hypothetical protein